MKKNKKAIAEMKHAIKRFKQRFGIRLTEDEYNKICKKIRNHETEIQEKQSRRIAMHRIKYRGICFDAIYDKVRKKIVTFLYPVEFEQKKRVKKEVTYYEKRFIRHIWKDDEVQLIKRTKTITVEE